MTSAPISKMMILRTAVLMLAWLNQVLVLKGYSPLPFSDEQTEAGVSALITFCASWWTWFKNNDIRYKARRNTQYLKNKGLK